MAWTTEITDRDSVANWTQAYIWRETLIPLAYRVPQITLMDSHKLPAPGHELQVNLAVEQTEMADLSSYEVTTIATNDTLGVEEIVFGKRTYTIVKRGKSHNITDLSMYDTLGDLAGDSSNLLKSVGARTLASLFYDACAANAGGFQWFRQDRDSTAQKIGLTFDSGTTTTIVCDELTEADDFWNTSQVQFTSGKLTGQSFAVSDYDLGTTTLTVGTMPHTPTAGDKFNLVGLGDDTATISKLTSLDTPTLKEILLSATMCRMWGAASEMRGGGLSVQYDAAGIRREVSPSVANGVVFLHDILMQELFNSMSDTAIAASQALWQSDEGYSTIVGGGLRRMGGLLFVPINYHKRASTSTYALSNTTGDAWPIMILFKGCGLVTTLKANKGNRHGLIVKSIIPDRNDLANMYDSIKMRNELFLYNAYGPKNGLHGCVHWCGTSLM